MKVTFLGTNGWYDSVTGNTCSALVQSKDYDIIFDAGNGIAKADRYITQKKPVFLFISHLHIDHIAGLHTLVKFRFREGLNICVQAGCEKLLNAFVAEPFTVPFDQMPFPVKIHGLHEGLNSLPFPVECQPLVHPVPCYGFRIKIDGRVISYCTDTGVCDNAIRLAHDADLYISECSLRPGEESPGWPHLNPDEAIGIARKANAKRLVFTHFGAENYKTLAEREEVQKRFEVDCPGLVAATDGLTIEV
jgi:ribonuclease BN (tRNA processing enzyme)